MTTCCSSGKARVYYNIPQKGGLKYRIKGEKTWKTILADEPLTSSCIVKNNDTTNYVVQGTADIAYGPEPLAPPNGSNIVNFTKVIPGPISGFEEIAGLGGYSLNAITPASPSGKINILSQSGAYRYIVNFTYTVTREDNKQDKKQFTITGTDTNTKYVDMEVDECPDVQTIPCKFDPAKERFRDVETSTNEYVETCFNIQNYTDPYGASATRVLLERRVLIEKLPPEYPNKFKIDPPHGFTVIDVASPKGCPPPKARVECCPNGICGEDKKCPKGTSCEMVCNGFKCCYDKNGKLIRSIKL